MKSKRSLRFFSNTLTAAGLVLAVSACSTLYQDEWNQDSNVPDLNQPTQRSQALLDYCKRLHSRGDLNLAAGICNRAHEINPTDPMPLIELARVLEELEMTGSAEEAYRAALLLDPEQTDALYGLGKIYIDQQRYDLATGPLEAAAHAETEDPRIYNALGVIMDQQGQHADAQTYYRQGLTHSPRNVSLRNNLGLSMVLDGQPEAGLAMLRDVAAEPAAGATAGHNLEMASQIAAQRILAEPGDNVSALDSSDMPQQAGEMDQSPHGGVLWPSQELSGLSPSSTMDEADAPASEPLPLLQPYSRQHGDSIPETMPVSSTQNMRSLDHEMVETMVPLADEPTSPAPEPETHVADVVESAPEAAPEPETHVADIVESAPEAAPEPEAAAPTVAAAELEGEMASDRRFEPATPQQTAALAAAEPAADSTADPLADPAADPAASQENDIPRDWSLAAQTVFATSRVAIPEPSRITSQERTASNDSFHATPAPEASRKTSSEPAKMAQADPHGDLAIAPASTPETTSGTSLVNEGYPIDEDTFYTAQLASFLTVDRARAGWQILKESAGELLEQSDAFIVRADLGEELGTYYRVRAGTMDDRAAASQFCQDLEAEGLECIPVEASWKETSETLVDKICQTGSTGVLCRTVKRSDVEQKSAPPIKG